MPSVPLISVIVPIYRAKAFLSRCIDSVVQQTHPEWELLLVDDGSPDGCPAICDAYAETNPRIHVIHQTNKGVSAARNTGLDAARGDYIAFVDADDWVEPDYLSYLLQLLASRQAKIAACNHFVSVDIKDVPKFPVSSDITVLSKKEAYDGLLYHQPPDASVWGKLFDQAVFDQLRFPQGRIFEDTWLIADLLDRADGLVYGAQPKYHYVYHQNTISKGTADKHMWDYLDAVNHLCEVVLQSYPDLLPGCTRRRVHAALSIRRLLVHADVSAADGIRRCQNIIRPNAKSVLFDRRAPQRDKAGILLALSGRSVFDGVWGLYDKMRRKY